MLEERLTTSWWGKAIAWCLLVTTQFMTMHIAYAQDDMAKAVAEANALSKELLNKRSNPTFSSDGSLMVNGKAIMTKQELTGQRDNDYIPADTDTYGSDSKTLIQGQLAKDKYEQKTLETAESSGERAYHLLKKSFATQKPDLSNDPMWNNTDNVLDNLTDIAKDFANCTLTTELISTGKDYHVPKYETCEKLPVVEETFTIGHEYKVGILRHKSGPVNLVSCGNGCTQVWIGTVGNNYWSGSCTIYEENMSVEVLQPDKITYAVLDRSKFDDYHQVYLNGVKIYNGPNGEFPPEVGTKCELSTSWDTRPNINVTSSFTSVPEYGEIKFKTRTSVAGEGEGYSSLLVYYNMNDLVYGDNWTTQENIDKAFQVKKQIDDGYCTGSFQCTDMPSLDAAGCTVMNGVKVCESNFKSNPLASLGISPFCRKVEVTSNCGFNEGQFCSKDLNGVERCFDNDTVDRNQCKKYEENPTCSYIKSECVEGAEGSSGHCYVQEDTYDCGFTASTGQPKEEQVLRCDGKLQCVGENCYSPARDGANEDFGKVNAYLEMLKYAKADMTCQGIPESPYDADAPPDQYIPVPSCADGFVYNKQTNQCLKPTGCTYSDNDFYAASSRNGIQVLVGNQVVVDDASVPTCIPVKKNGVTYTCGEAKKKLATDTFYEVCTNAESPVIPSGCPSPDHTLNPKTGYCEVPPIVTCPDGFTLHQGNDLWSSEDDFCRLETPVTYNCDKSHEYYNPETGVCEGLLYEIATCEEPMDLANDICSATITDDVQCPSGQSFISSQEVCSQTLVNNATCPSGSSLENDRCNGLLVEQADCPSGQSLKDGVCTVTLSSDGYCDVGDSLTGDKCLSTVLAEPTCPENYDYENGGCEQTEYASVMCFGGWTYNNGSQQCEIRKEADYVEVGGSPNCSGMVSGYIVQCELGKVNKCTYVSGANGYSCRTTSTSGGEKVCPDGYGYVRSKDICEQVKRDTPMCPTGFEYKDGTCVKESFENPICPDGYEHDSSKETCIKNEYYPPLCQDGYGYNFETDKCEKTLTSNPICDAGFNYNIVTNQCEKEIDTAPICPNGFGYDPVANKCKKVIESSPECQTGYEYYEGECSKYISTGPTCPDGYAYSTITDQCELKTSSQPRLSCDTEGTAYHAPTNTCRLDIEAQQSCPSQYPIWNEAEGRCTSKGPSPLADARAQFELNSVEVELTQTQTQQIVAMALAPFEHMLDTLIPKANASSELQGSEEAKLTQETMQQYVAEQFLSMAEEQQKNIALTTVGRQQLMGLASASSTAQPMSMSTMSTSSVTTSSGGDTNVTCELFKGTASECKIAVGGMQNCCESPVAVTLADYISLTTKMMQMDALTGQVMGLENYPGVWETASTWGSATAQSAWSAVQGEFISPADIVAQMGTDGANKGLMSAVAQQMMQYTNQFLIDTFGPEVAKMFFQEVGTSAAGEAVLGASAEMAAAGQALMYVYYAYLAYVVFNLLVNVIYECEEEELDLAMKRELLSTHKIGSYCKTEVLGSCIEKRQSYCVFDSPLSRIMMEQIYAQSQMNLNWGTAKKPNCTGVGIQDLDKVDWDKVNLDEWIGILISTGNYTDMVNVNIDSLTGKGSNLNTQQGGTDRNNVLEANRERMENIDADEVRRDAYEDAWSRSQ